MRTRSGLVPPGHYSVLAEQCPLSPMSDRLPTTRILHSLRCLSRRRVGFCPEGALGKVIMLRDIEAGYRGVYRRPSVV